MIGKGGRCVKDVMDAMPTVMAAWYIKSTYASRPTPYVVMINEIKSEERNETRLHSLH